MSNIIRVNFRHRPPLDDVTAGILELDRAISVLDERRGLVLGWLATSPTSRRRLRAELRDLTGQIEVLERARLRLTGAEICVLKGGKS